VAGVPLGAARAAIDYAVDAIELRVEQPSGHPYKNNARVQSVIAEAEMMLGAARSYLFLSMEKEWKRLEKHEQPTTAERANAWLSRVNVGQASRVS
jgi:alkylation response protein AidB-like acyl-CoA dehydrogenase